MSVNVVLGAGGATGQECVKRLLAATTSPVRAVVRSPDKYKDAFPQNSKLEVVAGDVTDPESLRKVLKDAKGIIFAASSTTFWGPAKVDYEVCKQRCQTLPHCNSIAAYHCQGMQAGMTRPTTGCVL